MSASYNNLMNLIQRLIATSAILSTKFSTSLDILIFFAAFLSFLSYNLTIIAKKYVSQFL
jgi:hypothetical protein